MLINIDSNYRDFNEYPNISEFKIPINSSSENNIKITNDEIQTFYKWEGNSSFNTPLSQIQNDTLKISIVAIDSNKLIIANKDLRQNYNNLIGSIFYNNVNFQSSEVIQVNQNIITLKENIFDIFFDNITTVNDIYNMYDVIADGFFINKSKHNTNNLQILGTKNILNDFYLYNLDKKWETHITYNNNKNVYLKNLTYNNDDYFLTRKNKRPIYNFNSPIFENGIKKFKILESSARFELHDIIEYENVKMKVASINNIGEIQTLIILNPGNNIKESRMTLSKDIKTVTIEIIELGNGIISNDFVDEEYSSDLVSIIDRKNMQIYNFILLHQLYNIFYIDIGNISKINKILLENKEMLFTLTSYQKFSPNLNIITNFKNNYVKAKLKLLSISLPNINVIGYNTKLSNLPFLILQFSNETDTKTNIITNDPNLKNANFIIPIANIKNSFDNYITIRCFQHNNIKLVSNDYFSFKLMTPNGKILQFSDKINKPINTFVSSNQNKVYSYKIQESISCNFCLDIE